MSDHARYEELTALAAGGYLSADEYAELGAHFANCPECQRDAQELQDLVHSGLPLTKAFSDSLKKTNAKPDEGARDRFLARARSEGLRFSPKIEKPESSSWLHFSPRLVVASALACALLLVVFYGVKISNRLTSRSQAKHEVARLTGENASLTAQLASRDQELASREKQLRDLRAQLGTALGSAENYRREGQEKGVRLEGSNSETVQLLNELENRDKQLAGSTEEIGRINQLRATDKISLDAQRIRIKEISDQLRIADATLDMKRQLSAAGQDIRQLLVSRQLHVVDVRDTDENGKPSPAFARVFLTEGKSLMFFAFDLNEAKVTNASGRFQVWGEQLGKKDSVRSLGVLTLDDRTQNRWVLKMANPSLLNEVNAVFVTTSPSGANTGARVLHAYLGQPNHS